MKVKRRSNAKKMVAVSRRTIIRRRKVAMPQQRKSTYLQIIELVEATDWRVFPIFAAVDAETCSCNRPDCKQPGKHPRIKGYKEKASNEPAQIEEWHDQFDRRRECGWGIITGGGLVVLDVDPRNGGDKALAAMEAEHGPLPETVTCLTGGGGRHCYFRHDGTLPTGDIADGVEVKADRGTATVPPSRHKSGRPHRWKPGCSPFEMDPEPLPPWIVERVREAKRGGHKSKATGGGIVAKGDRHNALMSRAGLLRARGCEEEEIRNGLLEHNATFDPPFTGDEITDEIGRAVDWALSLPPVSVRVPDGRTELANAKRFSLMHGHIVRYCYRWKTWLVWDRTRWRKDDLGTVQRLAKEVPHQIWMQAHDADSAEARGWAAESSKARSINAMLALAQSEVSITPDELDTDHWLLNCPNGTVDLRTGELRQHRQEDFITKLCPTPYDPDAECPRWEKFLRQIFDGNTNLVEFMPRLLGLWLTGDIRDQIVTIFWGDGSNGKSTLLKTFMKMLGEDYCTVTVKDLLIRKWGDRHLTTTMDLRGMRMALSPETMEGAKLDTDMIKQHSGGEAIRGNRMCKDTEQFDATHKLVIGTNHRPKVTEDDHGIWRRLALVPFKVKFWNPTKGESGPRHLKADLALDESLLAESAGILAWAVRGCREWQRDGLQVPPEIQQATEEYRLEENTVGRFINEKCVRDPAGEVKAGTLYSRYKDWCLGEGERYVTQTAFGLKLKKDFKKDPRKNATYYIGVRLVDPPKTVKRRK